MTSGLRLVNPSIDFKESFLAALAEFQAEGLPWMMDLEVDELRRDFGSFVQSRLKMRAARGENTAVDQTELWAALGDVFVGRIGVRHALNEDLRMMGGHIGYDTRPSYRGRGIATQMLSLALPVAKKLGLEEVLITCDDSNRASIRVIEKNGGILRETKPLKNGVMKRYYWIDLSSPGTI